MDKKAQWSLVGAAWVLVAAVIVIGVLLVRHLGSLQAQAAADPAHPEAGQTPGIQRVFCPVDHTELTVLSSTPKVVLSGTIYYFCDLKDAMGRSHKTLFLMDPGAYVGLSPAAAAATAPLAPAAPAPAPAPAAVTPQKAPATALPLPAAVPAAPKPSPTASPVFTPY